MKIESISRLLNSFGSASNVNQNQSSAASTKSSEEAVKVSSGFGKSAVLSETSAEDRGKRVADIKRQVEEGTYRPSSTDVAQSVARELFA
jgi:anti-sigma28 factor (negative regulator of flagellin synthesis)